MTKNIETIVFKGIYHNKKCACCGTDKALNYELVKMKSRKKHTNKKFFVCDNCFGETLLKLKQKWEKGEQENGK